MNHPKLESVDITIRLVAGYGHCPIIVGRRPDGEEFEWYRGDFYGTKKEAFDVAEEALRRMPGYIVPLGEFMGRFEKTSGPKKG